MQVLCKSSHMQSDVRCKVCGQGFLVYWPPSSRQERESMRQVIQQELTAHHDSAAPGDYAHPRVGFSVAHTPHLPPRKTAPQGGLVESWAL